MNSYMSKQDIINQNAKKFKEDCIAFELGPARFGKQYTTVCMGDGCSNYCT